MSVVQESPTKDLDVYEAQKFFLDEYGKQVHIGSIYRAARDGGLKSHKPFGKVLFRKDDLINYWNNSGGEEK